MAPIAEHPEDIINIASKLACREYGPIILKDGFKYHLSMGKPAVPSLGFGGFVDLDVNWVRVLIVE